MLSDQKQMDRERDPLWHLRAMDATQAEMFRKYTAEGIFDLTASERWWRDRSQILKDHGYQLRYRLRPGWKPSWEGTDLNPLYCEDSISRCNRKVVDAVRMSDGKDVAIMNLLRDSRERDILLFVHESRQSTGEDQHIVPILDRFEDDREPTLEFFVMPLLRKYNQPGFDAVSEVVDLFRQLLIGLVFMHSIGVAHRDCSNGNIMMDAPSIFQNGFHPCTVGKDRGGFHRIVTIPRYKATGPVNYYFIDFDISRRYKEDSERLVFWKEGADRDVPEFAGDEYDPFPADVFILGNVFKKRFLPEYQNLRFLVPLVDAMTAKDPKDRPTSEEALKTLKSIVSSQNIFTLRRMLVGKDEKRDFKSDVLEDLSILVSAAFTPLRYAVGMPVRALRAMRGFVAHKIPRKKAIKSY